MENSGKQNPKMGFKSPTLVLKNFATSRRLFLPAPAGFKLVAVDLNPRPSCYEPDEVHSDTFSESKRWGNQTRFTLAPFCRLWN